jgi:outer membrane protein TolC
LTVAGLGAGALPALAEDLPKPAPMVPVPAVPEPHNPTPGELPTGSTQPSNLPQLSFEEVIALARKNNRTIKADRATLAAAETATEAAWSALLPQINGHARYTHNYAGLPTAMFFGTAVTIQSMDQGDVGAHGTIPLLAPAAWAALKSVNANVDSARANFEAQESELLVSVGQAFLAAAGTDELVEARRSSLVVARATL